MKHTADLIRQGSLMFLALTIFNVLSLLYQLYMVRNLSAANYGVLNSLFSILVIVSIPSGALQTVVTKSISTSYAFDHRERINLLLWSFVKRASVFGLAISLILILASKGISSFLQIASPLLIVILGVISFFSVILPLTQGALQGLQRFGYLGLIMITNGSLKLLLGIIFVGIGFEVIGAMSALAISTFIALLLSLVMLGSVLPRPLALVPQSLQLKSNNPDPEMNFSQIYRYFCTVATVFLCFMILTNIDVVLVKHFFEPLQAGYYSIAQMVGKIIIFLPMAIIMVMFPKVSSLHAQNTDTLPILKKSLAIVGLLCGMGTLICMSFPSLIIRLLAGKEHLECIFPARLFAVAMTFFALMYTLLFYQLSIHKMRFIYPLITCTILQIVLIALFHNTLSQVLYIMCGNAVLLFLINTYLTFGRKEFHVACRVRSNS